MWSNQANSNAKNFQWQNHLASILITIEILSTVRKVMLLKLDYVPGVEFQEALSEALAYLGLSQLSVY